MRGEYWDKLRDLHRGDFVKYQDVMTSDGKKISGCGEIIGFGRSGETDVVWIRHGSGEVRGFSYEQVEKL